MLGVLWVPLHEDDSFDQNCARLAIQVQKAGAAVAAIAEGSIEIATNDVNESLAELTRLREDLSTTHEEAPLVESDGEARLAHVPAGVPKLPPNLRVTPAITELKQLLLSTDTILQTPRIGFYGMGGIGKTVTGAALANDEDIRRRFSTIIWLPLGQTPVIEKMQQLLYLQATGKELHAETAAERKEQLRIKLARKRVLVVLDDLVRTVTPASERSINEIVSLLLVSKYG
eukprot:SAG31_NODE_1504_length_8079_cov_2.892607_4_plen_230_part_00